MITLTRYESLWQSHSHYYALFSLSKTIFYLSNSDIHSRDIEYRKYSCSTIYKDILKTWCLFILVAGSAIEMRVLGKTTKKSEYQNKEFQLIFFLVYTIVYLVDFSYCYKVVNQMQIKT